MSELGHQSAPKDQPEKIIDDNESMVARQQQRRRTLKSGKVIFAGGNFSLDCTIRNMSAAGVLILVSEAFRIPGRFQLVVNGETHECEVAWRESDKLGAKFI